MADDFENKNEEKSTLLIVAADHSQTRGRRSVTEISTEQLSINISMFVQEINKVLEKTPEKLGKFRFEEFEISAEISAKGTLAVLGSGGEAGANGGIKFVFRRAS